MIGTGEGHGPCHGYFLQLGVRDLKQSTNIYILITSRGLLMSKALQGGRTFVPSVIVVMGQNDQTPSPIWGRQYQAVIGDYRPLSAGGDPDTTVLAKVETLRLVGSGLQWGVCRAGCCPFISPT